MVQDGHLVGIITLNRVKELLRSEWTRRTVGETMTPVEKGVIARPEDKMTQLLEKWRNRELYGC